MIKLIPIAFGVIVAVGEGAPHALGQGSGPIAAWGDNLIGQCDVPEPNDGFVSAAAGITHGVGLKADSSIVSWGVGPGEPPGPNSGFVAVSAGWNYSVALRSDGTLVAWGDNRRGQCDVPEPNTGFMQAAAGWSHCLAVRADGSVAGWGDNSFGVCDAPAPNTDFVAVAAGVEHSLGLKSDGTIVAWGRNSFGECTLPVPNGDFVAISAGTAFSLALKRDGSVLAWGINFNGQCDVPAPNSGFIAIAAGFEHALGLRSDGSVVSWGASGCCPPTPNAQNIAIAAGQRFSLAVRNLNPDVLRVPQDYPTIQAAIDAARGGDEVLVADGAYAGKGNTNLNPHGKPIRIRAEHPQQARLLGDGPMFYFESGESPLTEITGFWVESTYRAPDEGVFECRNTSSPIISSCWSRSGSGGAHLRCESGSGPRVSGCEFSYSGSPAVWSRDAHPTLSGCNFGDLTGGTIIVGYGGAVTLDGCSFVGVDVGPSPVIRMENGELHVHAVLFSEVLFSTGRMIEAIDVRANLTSCWFDFTSGQMSGIDIRGGSAELDHCQFSRNVAARGGAIHAADATLRVRDCRFVNNTVTSAELDPAGGSLFASNCDVLIEDSRFSSGASSGRGGAIAVEGGVLNVIDCIVAGQAVHRGGGIDASDARVTLAHTVFHDCTTQTLESKQPFPGKGGAIFAINSSVEMYDCAVRTSSANQGGGVYLDHCTPGRRFENCEFSSNIAYATGGSVHDESSSPSFIGCMFLGSGILPSDQCNGSGICGGAGLFSRGSEPILLRSSFVANDAGGGGYGGAFSTIDSEARIEDCLLDSNGAIEGGALAFQGSAISLVGSTLLHNRADEAGAVWSSGGSLNVARSQLLGNESFDVGTAVVTRGTRVTLCDSILVGQFTTIQDPGVRRDAISARLSSSYTITGCTVVGNVLGGGPIVRASSLSVVDVANSIFWGNDGPVFVAETGASASVAYSDIQGGLSGPGNIESEPLFVRLPNTGPDGAWGTDDDEFGDLRLQANSPCIDAGSNSRLAADVADSDFDSDIIEPDPLDAGADVRRFDVETIPDTGEGEAPVVDIGAYEAPNVPTFAPCDWDRSGVMTSEDFFLFLADFFDGRSDFDGNGVTNSGDFFSFITCFMNE